MDRLRDMGPRPCMGAGSDGPQACCGVVGAADGADGRYVARVAGVDERKRLGYGHSGARRACGGVGGR